MIVRIWKGKRKGWIKLKFRVKTTGRMRKLLSEYIGTFIDFESIEEVLLAMYVLDKLPPRWRKEVSKFIQAYISLYGRRQS
jgi:hypothetical protein